MSEHEQLLKNLVKIRSYSGEEDHIRNFIVDWLNRNNIETLVQDGNVLTHFKGTDSSRAIIFNSHMDTVTGGKKWKTDPIKPITRRDKMIGLGTSDMKAGLAASLLVARDVKTSGIPLVDLWFTYVVNEEVDGSGTESFGKWFDKEGYYKKYKDIAGIFTEPTSLTEVEIGHRGNLFVQVAANGESGHSSRPDDIKGTLAVRKIINFGDRLKKEVVIWKKEYKNSYFKPSITVGEFTSIFAGVMSKEIIDKKNKKQLIVGPASPNKFPAECIATFDLRTIPEFHDIAKEKITKLGEEMEVKISMLYKPAPAGFTEPTEKIVKVAANTLGKRKIVTSHASADAGFLIKKGVKSVILGPGERLQCHVPNEYCYPSEVLTAVNIYKAIIENWAK